MGDKGEMRMSNKCRCTPKCDNWWCGLSCQEVKDQCFFMYLLGQITDEQFCGIVEYLENYTRKHIKIKRKNNCFIHENNLQIDATC